MLKLSCLARSTFYYRQKLLSSGDRHAALKTSIRSIFDAHKGRYGYRRVTAAIHELGQTVNHKTVQRLMVEMGLKSLVRPKKYRSYKGQTERTAPDLIQRRFSAQHMHQKWVTDATEFSVAGDELFLSPVMDLHNGEIIAFETARRPAFKLVKTMLDKALARLDDEDRPILHSDGLAVPDARLEPNAGQSPHHSKHVPQGQLPRQCRHGELLRTLKSEFFYPNSFESIESLREGIEDYIRYYSNDRIKPETQRAEPCAIQNPALKSSQPMNRPTLWGQFTERARYNPVVNEHMANCNMPSRRHAGRRCHRRTDSSDSGPCTTGCAGW